MSVDNCKRCGQIYQKTTHNVCPNCVPSEMDHYREVSHFIRDHPGVTLEAIAARFNLPISEVETLVMKARSVRPGRSRAPEGEVDPNGFKCARCGRITPEADRHGSFCVPCHAYLKHRQEQERATAETIPAESEPEPVADDTMSVSERIERQMGPEGPKQVRYGFKRLSGEYIMQE